MSEAEVSKIQQLGVFIRWHRTEESNSNSMCLFRNASSFIIKETKLLIDGVISNLEIIPENALGDLERTREDIIEFLEEILEELEDASENLSVSYEKYLAIFAESGQKINHLKDILEGNSKKVNEMVWTVEINDLQVMREKIEELCDVISNSASQVRSLHIKFRQVVGLDY